MMKKSILLVGVLLSTTVARAQGHLGFKIAPCICFNRVYTNPPNKGFSSTGASLRFKIGAIYDYPLRDNCYVSTGLFYSTQKVSIKNPELSPDVQEAHELHYLQIPLLLKLYTSEITLDTRLYAELGFMGQIKVNERNSELKKGQPKPFIEALHRWGLAGLLGIGVEYDTSLSTSLFAGLSYQTGLVSVIDKQNQILCTSKVTSYSDLLSIDLGARF